MSPRVWLGIVSSILLCNLGSSKAKHDYIPHIPGAALLIGWGPPNFMAVSMPHQTLPLLPEPNQPYIGGPLMYPSITRDGRIVASARLKSARPRRVAIATYSVAEKRWTEYAEGDYAGSVAISPDGSKLAFAGEASSHPAPLNMIDLKTVKRAPVLMLSLGS